MSLRSRVEKIERIQLVEPQIMVIQFGVELNKLSCDSEEFYRLEDESEEEFIERIKSIFMQRSDRALITVLIGKS